MAQNELMDRLGFRHPIVQVSMADSSTPALAAAVSNAGGLGSIDCSDMSPEQVRAAIAQVRALTRNSFSVSLSAGGYEPHRDVDPDRMLVVLRGVHEELGLPPPVVPVISPNPLVDQLEAVFEARPRVLSFAFGTLSADQITRLKRIGIVMFGTATTADEARYLASAGVDAIIAQGVEAGGHRGTFVGDFEDGMVPLSDLIPAILRVVSIPVIASGGIANGRSVAAVVKLGAFAAGLGTAFLPCPESSAPEAHKRALSAATSGNTVITPVFTGRPARCIRNAFTARLAGKEHMVLPFPQQRDLTRAMRNAAAKSGIEGYMALWAGQDVSGYKAMPAGVLVETLIAEGAQV